MSLNSDLRQIKAHYSHNPEATQAIKDVIRVIETHLSRILQPQRAKRAERGVSPDPSPKFQTIEDFAPEIKF